MVNFPFMRLSDGMDDPSRVPAHVKRRKGGDISTDQDKDEQAISESALNKLVGAADLDDLEEADPPSTLQCHLHPYQKQALYWMSELEKGLDIEKASKTLHPCWEAYHICDKYVRTKCLQSVWLFVSLLFGLRC
ncbi:hypothetical protein Taro_034642 [Colocasia esculenta]|uniref:Uncharacterized protein n=1 Tax=Colocasia esculenta TaxID=4460 RepID=A0A843WCH7_COLES|nr:hypothetical protein [Colocasia esculenta]